MEGNLNLNLNLVCPTCRRPYPPKLAVSGFIRPRLVDIVGHRPDGITSAELHAIVYATDPNGGPDVRAIPTLIHHANVQLRPQGYEIAALWKGRGARWVLREVQKNGKK